MREPRPRQRARDPWGREAGVRGRAAARAPRPRTGELIAPRARMPRGELIAPRARMPRGELIAARARMPVGELRAMDGASGSVAGQELA